MVHVFLLGDSVFDNAAYVGGGPDVVRQLQALLPAGAQASLRAVDGAVVADVAGQLARVHSAATHLVVSVGGNDALGHIDVLEEGANSVATVLDRLAAIRASFEAEYRAMLRTVLARRLRTTLCTIYEPRFPDPRLRRLAAAGLVHFNDVIATQAFAHGLPLIELRLVCDRDEDFANAIEPSETGGAKIARAIARVLAVHDFEQGRSGVFVR